MILTTLLLRFKVDLSSNYTFTGGDGGGWLDKSILKLISAPVWALAGAWG